MTLLAALLAVFIVEPIGSVLDCCSAFGLWLLGVVSRILPHRT